MNINPEQSVFSRYWIWLKGVVLHWDWGYNVGGGSVNDDVAGRIWVSVRLVTIGFLLGAVLGIILGAWQATRQYKASDQVATLWSLIILSTPTPVIIVVLQILAIHFNRWTGWGWFEFLGETGRHSGSWISPFLDRLQHLLLPTITLTVLGVASFSRYQRSLMLDTLNADYVRTARAKGLPTAQGGVQARPAHGDDPHRHAVRVRHRRRVRRRHVHRDAVRLARHG